MYWVSNSGNIEIKESVSEEDETVSDSKSVSVQSAPPTDSPVVNDDSQNNVILSKEKKDQKKWG